MRLPDGGSWGAARRVGRARTAARPDAPGRCGSRTGVPGGPPAGWGGPGRLRALTRRAGAAPWLGVSPPDQDDAGRVTVHVGDERVGVLNAADSGEFVPVVAFAGPRRNRDHERDDTRGRGRLVAPDSRLPRDLAFMIAVTFPRISRKSYRDHGMEVLGGPGPCRGARRVPRRPRPVVTLATLATRATLAAPTAPSARSRGGRVPGAWAGHDRGGIRSYLQRIHRDHELAGAERSAGECHASSVPCGAARG